MMNLISVVVMGEYHCDFGRSSIWAGQYLPVIFIMNLLSACLSLLIGITLGTNASMSVESFLQKRISNNPFEPIGNPLQWKHDSKRKVSQMHAFANCN